MKPNRDINLTGVELNMASRRNIPYKTIAKARRVPASVVRNAVRRELEHHREALQDQGLRSLNPCPGGCGTMMQRGSNASTATQRRPRSIGWRRSGRSGSLNPLCQ